MFLSVRFLLVAKGKSTGASSQKKLIGFRVKDVAKRRKSIGFALKMLIYVL